MLVRVRRSKVDQDRRGRLKTLPYATTRPELCAVLAVTAWTQTVNLDGPLWRTIDRHGNLSTGRLSVDAAADIIKRHAETAGINPERISPHSLRAGHVTEAKRNDAPDLAVMNQTHHARSESIVGYVREGDPFRHISAMHLGI